MWVVAWEDVAQGVGGAGSVAEVVVEGCLADAHSGDEALLAGLEVGVNVASKLNVFGDDGVKHRSVFPEVEGSEEGFCALSSFECVVSGIKVFKASRRIVRLVGKY